MCCCAAPTINGQPGPRWTQAAAEKRIKVRKIRGSAAVRVEIKEGN